MQKISNIPIPQQEMMLALAEMGASKDILAMLLEFTDAPLHKDHLRYLTGPVVLHRSQWMDIVPEWLIKAIIPERLSIVLQEHEEGSVSWRVGPAELTATIMPASMDAPLSHDIAEIYLWASACAVAQRDNKPATKVWASINNYPFPEDDITKPRGRYFYDYQRICGDVRRAVVRAEQQRSRGKKKQSPQQPFSQLSLLEA